MPKIIISEELYEVLSTKSKEKGITLDDFLLEVLCLKAVSGSVSRSKCNEKVLDLSIV